MPILFAAWFPEFVGANRLNPGQSPAPLIGKESCWFLKMRALGTG